MALSHDHTFVAVGHAFGHIQLYDFHRPQTAARTVNPTSLAAVASGRQEGHIFGSRIVALGFIAGRHTAFASADDQGMAFYHSLGKVLFMDANDCLRILGKYPEEELMSPSIPPVRRGPTSNGTSTNGTTTPRAAPNSLPRKPSTILSMGSLPLGPSAHSTDTYQLVAMLTPIKLVIIGLKPSPKTWFRRHREGDGVEGKRSRWRGCLAWYPSIAISDQPNENRSKDIKKNKRGKKVHEIASTDPFLAFSWGHTIAILRITESRVFHKVQNKKTGKVERVETGKVEFYDTGTYSHRTDVLSLQWINANVRDEPIFILY